MVGHRLWTNHSFEFGGWNGKCHKYLSLSFSVQCMKNSWSVALITKKNDLTFPLFIEKSGHGPAEETRGIEVDRISSASDVAMAEAMSVKATEDCLFLHGEVRHKQGETSCMYVLSRRHHTSEWCSQVSTVRRKVRCGTNADVKQELSDWLWAETN